MTKAYSLNENERCVLIIPLEVLQLGVSATADLTVELINLLAVGLDDRVALDLECRCQHASFDREWVGFNQHRLWNLKAIHIFTYDNDRGVG